VLLRSSRQAAALSKEAGLLSLVGKGVGGVLGSVGKAAIKHPVGALATVAGTGAALSTAIPNIQRCRQGMTQQSIARQRWGMEPRVVARSF
jgi:hypothetical protein